MRRVLAAFLGALTVAACSAFVGLDGLNVPNEGGTPEGGTDAAADTMMMDTGVDSPPPPACPSGKGSAMIEFDGHCIDALEVSFQQYFAFLGSLPDGGSVSPNMPPECSFKTTHTPDNVPNDLTLPVAWIDWCDAYAFCKWAGKDLCSGVDGGTIPASAFADPTQSLWMMACSQNGMKKYPYGSTYDPTACRETGNPDGGPNMGTVPSGTMKKCEGGYPGVFDMIGNIREWEAACNGDGGAKAMCRRRGGAFNEVPSASIDCAFDEKYTRDFRSESSGLRCCAQKK
jgi:formylglycine-generating enzyme required for sulfatase activity